MADRTIRPTSDEGSAHKNSSDPAPATSGGDQSPDSQRRGIDVKVALIGATATVLAAFIAGLVAINTGTIQISIPDSGPSGDDLQTTATSLEDKVATLTDELERVAEDRDRWKTRAESASDRGPTSSTSTTQADEDPNGYVLEFGDGTYIDLDTRLASRTGGPEFELKLGTGRFFTGEDYDTWADVTVAFVNDSEVSLQGCQTATRIQGEVVHLAELEQDESVCVHTSEDIWAAMKIVEVETEADLWAEDITFDVALFG